MPFTTLRVHLEESKAFFLQGMNFRFYQMIQAVVVSIFNRKKGEAVIKDMIQEMFICNANVLD